MEYHNTIIRLNEGRSKVFVGGMEDDNVYYHRGGSGSLTGLCSLGSRWCVYVISKKEIKKT